MKNKKEDIKFMFKCNKCGKLYIKNFINFVFVNGRQFELCDKCNNILYRKVSKHLSLSEFDNL